MAGSADFKSRLDAIRRADATKSIGCGHAYRNGQVLANNDDVSHWDNFDRYFKFYNIHIDEPRGSR